MSQLQVDSAPFHGSEPQKQVGDTTSAFTVLCSCAALPPSDPLLHPAHNCARIHPLCRWGPVRCCVSPGSCGWPGTEGQGITCGRSVVGLRSYGAACLLRVPLASGDRYQGICWVCGEGCTWQEVGQWQAVGCPQALAFITKSFLPARVSAPLQLIIALGASAQPSPGAASGYSPAGRRAVLAAQSHMSFRCPPGRAVTRITAQNVSDSPHLSQRA